MAGPVRTSAPLCLIVLTYVKPLEEVDALLPAHVAWLDQGYAQGLFLVSGRRVPRTGGVIVTRGERDAVDRVARALAVWLEADQAGLDKDFQMLGNRGLSQIETGDDLAAAA